MTLVDLYSRGEYTAVVTGFNIDAPQSDERLVIIAWAYHQLGDYDLSTGIFEGLVTRHRVDSELGQSARRGLAHGYYQQGKVEITRDILEELPASPGQANLRANGILEDARRGRSILMLEIQQMIGFAQWAVPYERNHAHIINNLVFAMYEARQQEEIQPYLCALPGLIEVALGIYQQVNAPKNHIAGCLYRAALIFLDFGWLEGARTIAQESIESWEEVLVTEESPRYRENLANARKLLQQIEERIAA